MPKILYQPISECRPIQSENKTHQFILTYGTLQNGGVHWIPTVLCLLPPWGKGRRVILTRTFGLQYMQRHHLPTADSQYNAFDWAMILSVGFLSCTGSTVSLFASEFRVFGLKAWVSVVRLLRVNLEAKIRNIWERTIPSEKRISCHAILLSSFSCACSLCHSSYN